MRVSQFEFNLPQELIALRPVQPRDSARMLVVGLPGGLRHARVADLPEFLDTGDVIAVNDSRVFPARLRGRRAGRSEASAHGVAIEAMLHKRLGPHRFLAFVRPAKRLKAGETVLFANELAATVLSQREGGEFELGFSVSGSELDSAIARIGETPLPPYIANRRPADARDVTDYQTWFADKTGSVAAPTAGLHFTPELLTRLESAGIERCALTLHVGAGTFLPVSVEDTDHHRMHSEWATIDHQAARKLNNARAAGSRIVAVGTTCLRTLESAAQDDGRIKPFRGETDIFITPGYRFKTADVLLTNFHLPRSTLFMLVCAFAGTDVMREAYAEAIREKYRFYSYGDATLLFRPRP
jgi:S-adenosylmethionine:tRNA ribosyltransferase-isomerase